MNEASPYVTLRDYLRVARERRLLIIVLTLLFGAAGLGYSLRQHPTYQAEAALEFQSQDTQSSLFGQNVDTGGQTPDQRAASAAATLIRPPVLAEAKRLLKFPGPAAEIGAFVSARPEAQTNLVIVSASAGSGPTAAALANAVARAAVTITHRDVSSQYRKAAAGQKGILRNLPKGRASLFLRTLTQQNIARLQQLADVANPASVRRPASVPSSPSSPHTVRTTLLGLLVGLTLGLVAAFARDSLDRRLKTSHQIGQELHMPIVGQVEESALGRSLVKAKRRKAFSTADVEGFRIMRANVELLDLDAAPRVVLVTSALPEEGKSTVALGLAVANASAGKRTLLVEGDLRRPTLAARLGLPNPSGLSDYLTGEAEPPEILRSIELPNGSTNGSQPVVSNGQLVAIVAGTPTDRAADLLGTDRARQFFAQVRDAYDVVIVDSCPLLSVADTLELMQLADAVVLCTRTAKTTREQAQAARDSLARFPARPTGVVVTGIRRGEGVYNYGAYAEKSPA